MKPYKHTNPCPKCGDANASAQSDLRGEQVQRRCKNCGWSWYELPLDRSVQQEPRIWPSEELTEFINAFAEYRRVIDVAHTNKNYAALVSITNSVAQQRLWRAHNAFIKSEGV